MAAPAIRKPRARPPPPARKQSLPSLVSALEEEDAFDDDLEAHDTEVQMSTGGVRRARSEAALATATDLRSPLHMHGPKVLPTLEQNGVPPLKARSSAPTTPTNVDHPPHAESERTHTDTRGGGSLSPGRVRVAQPQPVTRTRRIGGSAREISTRAGSTSSTGSEGAGAGAASSTTSSRPRPTLQFPGPPASPAPKKSSRLSPSHKAMAAPPSSPLLDRGGKDELKTQLAEAREKLSETESTLAAQREKHELEMRALTEEVEQLRAQGMDQSNIYSDEVGELRAKVSELQASSRRCTALEKKLAAAEELANLAEEDAQAARDDVTGVRQQLMETQHKLRSATSASSLRSTKADEERLKLLEAQNRELREQVESLEGEKTMALSDYDTVAAEVERLRAQLEDSAQVNEDLAKNVMEHKEAVSSASQQAEALNKHVARLEVQLKESQQQCATAKEQANAMSKENDQSTEHVAAIGTLQQEVGEKDKKIEEIQSANDSLTEKVVVLRHELQQSNSQLEQTKSEVNNGRERVQKKEAALAALTEEVSELNHSLLSETSRCSELETEVLCLEGDKTNLTEQLQQLKSTTPSAGGDNAILPASTRSAASTTGSQAEDSGLSVTPTLVRKDEPSLSVGEVTRNEEVGTSDSAASPAQSPVSVRSNASTGTPPVIAPYSVHKKKTGSRDTTPETSPDTPRKDQETTPAAAAAAAPATPAGRSKEEPTSDEPVSAKPVVETSPETKPAERKETAKAQPHSFMKTNASSGAAALAAVMSGAGPKTKTPAESSASGQDASFASNAVLTPAKNAASPIPKRPAPTAKPRSRAPPPPAAKKETPTTAGAADDSEKRTETGAPDPVAAMAANLKAAVGESPKPSPKVLRKPPVRSLPQPPKKQLPQPPPKKEAAVKDVDDDAEVDDSTTAIAYPTGDVTGEFDAISPATMRKLGTSAGRERVRLGTQGGLAGRRKPTRTHLRGADSGDELGGSDAEVLTEDSAGGMSSNNDSPLVGRAPAPVAPAAALAAAMVLASAGKRNAADNVEDNADGARTSTASEGDTEQPGSESASPRPNRAATMNIPLSRPAPQNHPPSRDDAQVIDEDEKEDNRPATLRAKTLGGVGLPLGGFLPQGGGGPMKPSDLKKGGGNVTKPSRRPPAPTPPGRQPPPAPLGVASDGRPDATEANGVNGGPPLAETPDNLSEGTSDSSDDENTGAAGEGLLSPGASGAGGDAHSGSQHVTSPSSGSLTSPQHGADGESSGFSVMRDNRRSGLRTTMDWSVDEVANWLHLMDLPELAPIFTKFDVDGQKLLALDGSKMKAMGVTNSNHVASLKKELKTMKAQVDKMLKDEKKRLEREAKVEKKRKEEEAKLAKRKSRKQR